jgi:transketolase
VGHADLPETPGLEISGGLLGLGLPIEPKAWPWPRGTRNSSGHEFGVLGDGQIQEETSGSARGRSLISSSTTSSGSSTTTGSCSKGFVAEVMGIEPVADKSRAFSWDVVEVSSFRSWGNSCDLGTSGVVWLPAVRGRYAGGCVSAK